jgi:hypothetical protein
MITDQPTDLKRKRFRMRVLLVVAAVVLGLYLLATQREQLVATWLEPIGALIDRWSSPTIDRNVQPSRAAQQFMSDAKALGGKGEIRILDPGLVGALGRAEDYTLSVGGPQFDDAALESIAERYGTKIVVLRLFQSRVTDAGLRHLSAMTRLSELFISGDYRPRRPIGSSDPVISAAGLIQLGRITSLEKLTLGNLPITDADLEGIKDLPSLTCLSLITTKVEGPGLATLKSFPRLTFLFLENDPITQKGLATLSGVTSLEGLSIWGIPLTKAALDPLKPLPHLRWLRLRNCGPLDASLDALAKDMPRWKINDDWGI